MSEHLENDDSEVTDGGHSVFEAERSKRYDKIDEMRSGGLEPYPYRFDRTHTLSDLRTAFGNLEAGTETEHRVCVAGRAMLIREQGKLIFATLKDRDGDLQLFVSKAVIGAMRSVTSKGTVAMACMLINTTEPPTSADPIANSWL